MHDFTLVFKTLYKNQNVKVVGLNGKKKLPQTAIMVLSMIPLIIIICAGLVFVTKSFTNIVSLANLMNIILAGTQMFILFTMLPNVVSTLYSSPDTPFLSSLPIRPTVVFFAKFATIYITALKTAALFVLPTLLTLLITYAVVGNPMFYGAFPLLFVILLVTPLLPLFVIIVFSMPIMWLGSYFKGKSVLKSILLIIFYIVMMSAYMILIYFLNTKGMGQEGDVVISQSTMNGLGTFATVMYPNKVLLYYCLGIEAGKNFGISFAITLAMLVLTLVLAVFFYKRITLKHIETRSEESHKVAKFKQNNIIASLMKRDFTSIMRNPQMAMSNFSNMLLSPIFIVVMYFIMNFKNSANATEMTPMNIEMMSIGFVVMYSLIFLCGTNMLAMMAYTREGESFFISKTLPIGAKESILAKLGLATIVPMACLVLNLIIAIALYKINIISVLLTGLCAIIMMVGLNCMNIYFDMKMGNVNWKTAADMRQASKNNVGSIIAVFSAIIPACVLMVMGILISSLEPQIGRVGVLGIFWAVAILFSIVICIVGVYMLKSKGVELYNKIGQNKKIVVANRRNSRSKHGGKSMLK